MTGNDTQTPKTNPNIMPPGGTAPLNPAQPNQQMPTAPFQPSTGSDKVSEDTARERRANRLALAVAGIGALGTIIAAIIAIIPSIYPSATPAPVGSYSTSAPNRSTTSAPTLTPVPAVAGAFDLTVIYGGRDSLTIHIKEESHLFGLAVNTPAGSETIATGFPALAAEGYLAPSGMCLRYIRTGAQPPLPRACNAANTIEADVESADVFWYDDRTNQYQDIALQQETTLVGLCPHAGGSGRCDFSRLPAT